MFKRLRNKFLMLNLAIISITMIIAFTTIYLITYTDVRTGIDMELRKLLEFNRRPNDNPKESLPNFDIYKIPQDFNRLQDPSERSLSFTLTTDSKGNRTSSFSVFNINDAFYETAKDAAFAKNAYKGNLKLDGTHWSFMIKPSSDGFRLVFLDITSRQAILTNLIFTFLIVAFVMLIAIYFISRFFANRSIKPIKEAFDKQKQFIGDASHELKTPLSVISTNVDVLLANGEDNINSQSKWLHYIKSEVERMAKLTNDLLYLTQMDDSDIKMIFSKFNISETVENVILTMEAVIFENNITLKYDIEPGLALYGNSEQIKQVVMILLDNALKYTNSQGEVNVNLKRSHNNTVLTVTNTGEGIPEDQLNKIFDRFYRMDKSRSRDSGGYGLGLAIAKAITEQHGGIIFARSILKESTTFTVELP